MTTSLVETRRALSPPHTLVRREGPVTSRDAARRAVDDGTVLTHEAIILRLLADAPDGLTVPEMCQRAAARWGVDVTVAQLDRRVAALIRSRQVHRPLTDPHDETSIERRGRFSVLKAGSRPDPAVPDLPLWRNAR